jgi:hypothetical protein
VLFGDVVPGPLDDRFEFGAYDASAGLVCWRGGLTEGVIDAALGGGYVFGSGEEGEVFDRGWSGRVAGLKEGFGGEGVAEAVYDLLCDVASGEAADASIEDGGGEEGMSDAEAVGFAEGDLADEDHALRGEGGGVAEADDEEFLGGEGSCGRRDEDGFAEVSVEEAGLADLIEQAVELFVDLDEGAVEGVLW